MTDANHPDSEPEHAEPEHAEPEHAEPEQAEFERYVAALPERSRDVARAIAAAGLGGRILQLPAAAATAGAAAAALGVAVGAIANSLVFAADGAPLLVMTSGAHRVDEWALAGALGVERIERASPDLVRRATGQAIGGVAPVGHPVALPTVVDAALAGYPQVWTAGGTPHTVVPMTFDELVALTGGRVLEVGP